MVLKPGVEALGGCERCNQPRFQDGFPGFRIPLHDDRFSRAILSAGIIINHHSIGSGGATHGASVGLLVRCNGSVWPWR